jgi:DNA-binding transcriptional LysR family regulator
VLHDALARIARATDNLITTQTHSVLTIRGYTTFFIHWLIPRLPAFQRIHANIEVKLPLGQAHLTTFELIPLTPLNPLRQLQGMTTGSPQDGR